MPPTLAEIASSAFRCASLRAATIRSCSISTSSLETTSGSIFSDCTCLAPLTTTVTMPPPALPSTRSSAICFCRRSCICCACFIICWMFITAREVRGFSGSRVHGSTFYVLRLAASPCSHFFDVANLRREHLQHSLDRRIGQRLLAQRGFLVDGLRRGRCRTRRRSVLGG